METTDSPERLWRTQFDKQFTDEVVERLIKEVTALIAEIEARTRWRDQLGPDDRLNNAIMKLLERRRRWDPERVDLRGLLLGIVRGDISHEIEHRTKFRQVSFDNEAVNREDLDRETSEVLVGARMSQTEVPRDAWWSQLLAQLRLVAREDQRVLEIVRAYEAGKHDRREVIGFTGLSPRQFDAAFRRLQGFVNQIDDGLRDVVLQAIA